MASIQRENIGYLNEKISVTIDKEDYLPEFEKSIKDYVKNANIPGFRKGMAPQSMIKKMYGNSIVSELVVKKSEDELYKFIKSESLKPFLQPIPAETYTPLNIDVNNLGSYTLEYEIGLTPELDIDIASLQAVKYNIEVDDKSIQEYINDLTDRFGKMEEAPTVEKDDNYLTLLVQFENKVSVEKENFKCQFSDLSNDVKAFIKGLPVGSSATFTLSNLFSTTSANQQFEKTFTVIISEMENTKVNLKLSSIENFVPATVGEEFFKIAFPQQTITTEAEFKEAVKQVIEKRFEVYSNNQLQHEVFHLVNDQSSKAVLPLNFIEKWKAATKFKNKEIESVSAELIAKDLLYEMLMLKIASDYSIEVNKDDIRNFAKQSFLSYMGGGVSDVEDQWLTQLLDKFSSDKKYIDENYSKIRETKILTTLATKVSITEKAIPFADFKAMVETHHHEHH